MNGPLSLRNIGKYFIAVETRGRRRREEKERGEEKREGGERGE